MSLEDFRLLLSSDFSPALVGALDGQLREFSQRRYLLSSVFYPAFVELCHRLFHTTERHLSLIRCDSSVFPLLFAPGGSLFDLLFRISSFSPKFYFPINLLPGPLVAEIKFLQQSHKSVPHSSSSGQPSAASPSGQPAISCFSPLSSLYWPLYRPSVDSLELSIHEYFFFSFANFLVFHEKEENQRKIFIENHNLGGKSNNSTGNTGGFGVGFMGGDGNGGMGKLSFTGHFQAKVKEIPMETTQKAYLALLEEYCQYFLPFPDTGSDGSSTGSSGISHSSGVGGVSGPGSGSVKGKKELSARSSGQLGIYSGIFLSILGQVWMGQNIYRPFAQFTKVFDNHHSNNITGAGGGGNSSATGNSSFSGTTGNFLQSSTTGQSQDLLNRSSATFHSLDRKSLVSSLYSNSPDSSYQLPSKGLLYALKALIEYLLQDPQLSSGQPEYSFIGQYHIDWLLLTCLRVSFLRWGNEWDTRLMILIGIWTDFLEPWRFSIQKSSSKSSSSSSVENHSFSGFNGPKTESLEKFSPIPWKSYVLHFSPLYTILFSDFLCLLGDLDLGREGGKTKSQNLQQLYSLLSLLISDSSLLSMIGEWEIHCNPSIEWFYQRIQQSSQSNMNLSLNASFSNSRGPRRPFSSGRATAPLASSAGASGVSRAELAHFRHQFMANTGLSAEQYIPVFFDSTQLQQELLNQSQSIQQHPTGFQRSGPGGNSSPATSVDSVMAFLRESSTTAIDVIRLLTPTGVRSVASQLPSDGEAYFQRLAQEDSLWNSILKHFAVIFHVDQASLGGGGNNNQNSGIPAGPRNVPATPSTPMSSIAKLFTTPDRDNRGRLTAAGKRQLLSGQRLCSNREAVPVLGDAWQRPPRSDEVALLLPLAKRLNDRWLAPGSSFNLRFLASFQFWVTFGLLFFILSFLLPA